ncbi:site-specific DNA-methyltransferase [Actinoallomurus acanthiterrae]
MREPYWHDKTATLYLGDAREVLAELADGSVDCIVTSPPPWTPGDIQTHASPTYGHRPTATLYIAALRRVFAEVHRVLADEGTAWIAISDQYAIQTGWAGASQGKHRRALPDPAMTGLPASSLIGLPWQLAFALHDDGWIIRNSIVCHHPTTQSGPFPEDRFVTSYELIFLLVKQQRYHFDNRLLCQPNDAGRPDAADQTRHARWRSGRHGSGNSVRAVGSCRGQYGTAAEGESQGAAAHWGGSHPADVWVVPARSDRDRLPIEVPLSCIAAGCRPRGTVLDMFAGTAITGLAARLLGRSFVGVEETQTLCRMAAQRLRLDVGDGNGGRR